MGALRELFSEPVVGDGYVGDRRFVPSERSSSIENYDPGQQRDAHGKWTSGASVDAKSKQSVDVAHRMKALLGTDDPHAAATLVGAPKDSAVRLGTGLSSNSLLIDVKAQEFFAKRMLSRDDEGRLYLHNDLLMVKPEHQGAGIGSDVFHREVEAAADAGVAYIETHAARDDDPSMPMNGYYTWPRLGYDAPLTDLPPQLRHRIGGQFPDAKSVLDLMETETGRSFWKKEGTDLFHAKFDLTPGSRSMRVHAAYTAERARRRPS